MLAQLRVLELRERAQATPGERSDIQRSHGAVLGIGPAPLPVVERELELFLAAP